MLRLNPSAHELTQITRQNKLVFINFCSSQGESAQQFTAVYTHMTKDNQDITFIKINAEKEAKLAIDFRVHTVPYLIIFKQGIIIYSDSGNLSESELTNLVIQAQEIDMTDIYQAID